MWREHLARAFSTLAIALVVIGMCAVTMLPTILPVLSEYRKPSGVLVVSDIDPGGMAHTYDMWWHRVADSGVLVVIDGDCVSACTFFMGIVPPSRVCVTDRATFGLHMASTRGENGQPEPNQQFTDYMIRRYYPQVVKDWIATHQPFTLEVQYMKASELKGYYRTCSEREYKRWPTENNGLQLSRG